MRRFRPKRPSRRGRVRRRSFKRRGRTTRPLRIGYRF